MDSESYNIKYGDVLFFNIHFDARRQRKIVTFHFLMKKVLIALDLVGFIVLSILPRLLCTGVILPGSDDSFLFGADILK